jgi:hypothetical protein
MSSVALHGNLRDFGIAEVFQLIGQQRKTGTLEVDGAEGAIFLAFDTGRVVRGGPLDSRSEREPLGRQLVRAGYLTREQLEKLRRESVRSARPVPDLLLAAGLIEADTLAEVQHLLTRETVFDVMRRQSGDFHFTAESVVHDTPPEKLLGAEQILMDGLRMLDEWRSFVDVVPSEDAVFQRIGDLESVRALTKGDGDVRLGNAERVLQLVDGRLSVRRIVDLSRIGTFDATRALAELRQAGVIDLVSSGARPEQAAARPAVRRTPLLPVLRAALGTTLPLLLLGLLGWTLLERADETGGLPGSAIPEPTLHQLGSRYEDLLVRSLIEAHYFEKGAYPVSLEEIAPDLDRRGLTLTPSQLADYYYAVRDQEVILLAPMH